MERRKRALTDAKRRLQERTGATPEQGDEVEVDAVEVDMRRGRS